MKHWLKQKQKLKRQKVTNIRKKNKRNVQKKITATKGFVGGGGGGGGVRGGGRRFFFTYTSL